MKRMIYVFSDGEIKRKDNTVKLFCEDKNKFIPVENISDIFIFGEVNITKKLLELLSQKEILMHYFNYYGYYMGSFYPREHYNSGHVILKQAEHYNDENKRIILARKSVEGSLKNIRKVLQYYSRQGIDVNENIIYIENNIEEIKKINDISVLLSIEGRSRENYYKSFDKIIKQKDFKFNKRTRRPPQNNLNTLISFGNSILYSLILSEIYKTHIDPRIGYLHTSNFRSFTLNLDISEIFKPIIIDRIIFTVVNKKIIKKNDFYNEGDGIILKENGMKKFVQEFYKRISQTIKVRNISNKVSYRRLIRLEIYKIQKHLLGENVYTPYINRW